MKKSSLPSRRQPLARSKKPIKRSKYKKRKPSEFARIYGSKERVEWVQRQPCVCCGDTPCDNAHIKNGGTGRKAGYTKIVPLCRTREDSRGWITGAGVVGCHEMYHRLGRAVLEFAHGDGFFDKAAAQTEKAWREHELSKSV